MDTQKILGEKSVKYKQKERQLKNILKYKK
jgi:hypothetical protein